MAYIEDAMSFDNALRLKPKYIAMLANKNPIHSMEITGNAIDDFFSPADYFYFKHMSGIGNGDMLYSNEVADEWNISFEGTEIQIKLVYGDILQRGVASDLILHPKLVVSFLPSDDWAYIYRVYGIITRFLQLVRYNADYGKTKVYLRGNGEKQDYNFGYLIDKKCLYNLSDNNHYDRAYVLYKQCIGRLLQFAANNPDLSTLHFPKWNARYSSKDYSQELIHRIFSAFEKECRADSDTYENVDVTPIAKVRESILEEIDKISGMNLSKAEQQFVNNAKGRLQQLGTQYGQEKKLINAYGVLAASLDNSIENIFWLPDFSKKGHLKNEDIKSLAQILVKIRGMVAHGDYSYQLSDVDAQKVRFLEILTYAQMLKRAGLNDEEIELVIGAVFMCNFKHQDVRLGR